MLRITIIGALAAFLVAASPALASETPGHCGDEGGKVAALETPGHCGDEGAASVLQTNVEITPGHCGDGSATASVLQANVEAPGHCGDGGQSGI